MKNLKNRVPSTAVLAIPCEMLIKGLIEKKGEIIYILG